MKKLLTLFLFLPLIGMAQPGYITTIAGNLTAGLSGDGGPATAAQMDYPMAVFPDNAGNVYINDYSNGRIRKVDALGVISTFAGGGSLNMDGIPATNAALGLSMGGSIISDGTNVYIGEGNRVRKVNLSTGIISTVVGSSAPGGYSGDGGPATAAQLYYVVGFCFDGAGNMFVCDHLNHVVRKVNAAGIISTYVGTGVGGFSGDGGPATAATLQYPSGICFDAAGNLYVGDFGANRIRKITPAGIISTFAGNGTIGFSGDGGPATAASFHDVGHLCMDTYGNMFVADNRNNCVRKITPGGIISRVAGGGSYLTNGVPAIQANFFHSWCVSIDPDNNLYITDKYNQRVCKVNAVNTPVAIDTYATVYANSTCSSLHIDVMPVSYYASWSMQTWFGDGQSQFDGFVPPWGPVSINHVYSYPGVYTIRHVLYNGGTPFDTITYTCSYKFCRTLAVRLYNDANLNCVFDSLSEYLVNQPVKIEIDSSGVPVDTVTILSGINYSATGPVGTIYRFKILGNVPGIFPACPTTGIIIDTLSADDNKVKYIGFNCSGTAGFDLKEHVFIQSGRHMQSGQILVGNAYCTPQSGVVTVGYSPKYVYQSAYPTPTFVTGTTMIWNLGVLSSIDANPKNIHYTLKVPGAWLTPGDTANSGILTTPTTGDMQVANNNCSDLDTVKSSYDPNAIDVSPSACINIGTTPTLTYTTQFENTGNDTALNISVLDTIPNTLDVRSLEMVSSSHYVLLSKNYNGSNWVLRFDFPNIKLLDSSYHDRCTGMFVYTMKPMAMLPEGTVISNRAGIYFDDNPVVMTNSAESAVCTPLGITGQNRTDAANEVIIYPNPATDLIHISNVNTLVSYKILNTVGATVLQGELKNNQNTVPVHSLAQGVYVIQVNDAKGNIVTKRFVKE